MRDGVLDERMQDQPRDLGVQGIRINAVMNAEAILESSLFNLQVLLHELQFLLQRHPGCAAAIEGEAQQVAEAADHPVGRIRLV